jgi:hypothetical protein
MLDPNAPDPLAARLRAPLRTPEDAAALPNTTSAAFRRQARRRRPRALRVGQTVRFRADDVRRLAAAVPGSGT